jgi:tetratricopeptide (TPR) repeat protein
MTRRFGDGEAEYHAIARRIHQERVLARETVERLLRSTPRDQWSALAGRPDLQTAGALECLGNTFAATLTRDPREAMLIAELAVAAAEEIAPDAYPRPIVPQLHALAWKDLGKALRFLGRNREALDAFATAEQRLEQFVVLGHDRAIVRFNLAMSLQELDRFEESRLLLAECKQVFDEHGDARNTILCAFAEGVLLQRQRRHREAREVYLLLFASTKDIDTETRAALHRAIGLCSIELADFRDAELNLTQAIALNRTLGQPLEVLKGQRCLGFLFIRRGDMEHGVHFLRPVRRGFLSKGLAEEAGLCGLDIVEGFLLIGRTSTAETLARRIVGEFTAADLNTRAIAALGYLTEALTTSRASGALVTEVREYIISLRTSPEREFAASS